MYLDSLLVFEARFDVYDPEKDRQLISTVDIRGYTHVVQRYIESSKDSVVDLKPLMLDFEWLAHLEDEDWFSEMTDLKPYEFDWSDEKAIFDFLSPRIRKVADRYNLRFTRL